MIKKKLKHLDKSLFDGKIALFLLRKRQKKMRKFTEKEGLNKIEIYYSSKNTNPLAELFDLYGSDKGSNRTLGHIYEWTPKSYSDFYLWLFEKNRTSIKRVFECGIGTNNPKLASSMGERGKPGASLRAWRDFFPNAQIFGADIDKEILFEENRITTGFINQLDKVTISEYFSNLDLDNLDLIIDDGLHTFQAAITLFECTYPKLADSGYYVIEDIHPDEIEEFVEYFRSRPFNTVTLFFTNSDKEPVGTLLVVSKSNEHINLEC